MAKNTSKWAVGTLIAGVAGYVAGILTAPKSGKETREDIKDKTLELKDESAEKLRQASVELQGLMDKAKDATATAGSKARAELNEAVIRGKDAQNKAKTVLKSIKDGQADDPNLDKALRQVAQARKNLAKYLKS